MAVAFEGPPDEKSGLEMFLEEQRAAVLRKLDGIAEDQAVSRSTVSDLCLLTLVKHVAFVERRWGQADIIRESIDGATGS